MNSTLVNFTHDFLNQNLCRFIIPMVNVEQVLPFIIFTSRNTILAPFAMWLRYISMSDSHNSIFSKRKMVNFDFDIKDHKQSMPIDIIISLSVAHISHNKKDFKRVNTPKNSPSNTPMLNKNVKVGAKREESGL